MGLSFSKSETRSSSHEHHEQKCTSGNCTSKDEESSTEDETNKNVYISVGAIMLFSGCVILITYSWNTYYLKKNRSKTSMQINNNNIANNQSYLIGAIVLTAMGVILTIMGVKAE